MAKDKRTMSFQFSKDGRKREPMDRRRTVEKKVETEWIFPEPDYVIDESTREAPAPIIEKEEPEREIHFWNERQEMKSTKEKPRPVQKHKQAQKHKVRVQIPWMLAVAVASAILIGVSLGVSMLSFLSGTVEDPMVNQPAVEVGTSAVPEEERATNLQIYVIQAGAFSTQEASNQASETIKNAGHPVVIDQQADTNYLYVAAGATEDQAKQLASQMKESGVDAFAKEYPLSPPEQQSPEADWLKLAGESLMDVVHTTTGSAVEEEKLTALTDKLTELENGRETAMEGASDEVKATAQTLMAKMAESSQLLMAEDSFSESQQLNVEALLTYTTALQQLNE